MLLIYWSGYWQCVLKKKAMDMSVDIPLRRVTVKLRTSFTVDLLVLDLFCPKNLFIIIHSQVRREGGSMFACEIKV